MKHMDKKNDMLDAFILSDLTCSVVDEQEIALVQEAERSSTKASRLIIREESGFRVREEVHNCLLSLLLWFCLLALELALARGCQRFWPFQVPPSLSVRSAAPAPACRPRRCPEPASQMRWDLLMALLIVFYMFVVPMRIAFDATAKGTFINGEGGWFVFDLASDSLFILDIAFNFRTTFRRAAGVVEARASGRGALGTRDCLQGPPHVQLLVSHAQPLFRPRLAHRHLPNLDRPTKNRV